MGWDGMNLDTADVWLGGAVSMGGFGELDLF